MAKEPEDLNAEDTGADESAAEDTASTGSEPLKNAEEELKARKLLDGTSSEKTFTIPKKRYDELRAVEEFAKAHAPLMNKVLSSPSLMEAALGKDDPKTTREEEISDLLEERKTLKRKEITEAVSEALGREKAGEWPDFEKSWSEIKPIADTLKHLPYREALRRGYLAVHPETASAEAEREAKREMNRQGTFSPGGSYSPNLNKIVSKESPTEAQRFAAKKLGYKDIEEYMEITSKHRQYAEEHGWWNPPA